MNSIDNSTLTTATISIANKPKSEKKHKISKNVKAICDAKDNCEKSAVIVVESTNTHIENENTLVTEIKISVETPEKTKNLKQANSPANATVKSTNSKQTVRENKRNPKKTGKDTHNEVESKHSNKPVYKNGGKKYGEKTEFEKFLFMMNSVRQVNCNHLINHMITKQMMVIGQVPTDSEIEFSKNFKNSKYFIYDETLERKSSSKGYYFQQLWNRLLEKSEELLYVFFSHEELHISDLKTIGIFRALKIEKDGKPSIVYIKSAELESYGEYVEDSKTSQLKLVRYLPIKDITVEKLRSPLEKELYTDDGTVSNPVFFEKWLEMVHLLKRDDTMTTKLCYIYDIMQLKRDKIEEILMYARDYKPLAYIKLASYVVKSEICQNIIPWDIDSYSIDLLIEYVMINNFSNVTNDDLAIFMHYLIEQYNKYSALLMGASNEFVFLQPNEEHESKEDSE